MMIRATSLNTWMKRCVLVCIGFMCTALTALPLAAEPLNFDTLKIRPFGFIDDEGRTVGSTYQMANAIALEAGLEIDNALVPLSRIIKNLQQDKPSCTIVTRSPFSESFSVAVANTHVELLAGVVAHKGTKLDSYEDLKGLLIGLTRGTHIEHPFDKDETLQKQFLLNDAQAVKMFQKKRVDAVAGSLEALQYNFDVLGMKPEDLSEPLVLIRRVFWVHCHKSLQNGDLFERLRKASERLHENGTLQKIWKRYAGVK